MIDTTKPIKKIKSWNGAHIPNNKKYPAQSFG